MAEDSALVLLTAALIRLTDRDVSVVVADAPGSELPARLLYQGPLTIRFAFAMLYEPEHFVPERVIDDFRREFKGAQAYDFLLERGDSFPRADVIGMRVSTGEHSNIFLKQLDLAAPLAAFAFPSADIDSALARIDAVIWVDDQGPAWSLLDASDERCPAILSDIVPCCRLARSHLTELRDYLRYIPL